MAENRAETKLSITGMSCGSCERHVRDALRGLDGVQAAEVDLRTNTATVTYDPTLVSDERMVAAITAGGYGAKIAQDVSELPVQSGCTCSSCG